LTTLLFLLIGVTDASNPAFQAGAAPAKTGEKGSEKSAEKSNVKTPPEPPIENVVNVTTTDLVDKPHDYLNKNVKFSAKFYVFSNLPLDYKPALRTSKTHLGFLVLRPDVHVPFSELKIAMPIPKEKDPMNQVLASLKDGDEVEVTGKVFAAQLDEPWVEVLRFKKTASAPEDKKEAMAASSQNTASRARDGAEMLKQHPPTKPMPEQPEIIHQEPSTPKKLAPDQIVPPTKPINTPSD
jgi:hypothetical protein